MTALQVGHFSPSLYTLADFHIPATPSTPASASQWKPLSSLLSPWKRAATEIELQFALRHLGEDLSRGDTRNAASASLNQLTDQIFSHSFTRDEASFVATIVQCAGAEVAGKVHHFLHPHPFKADTPSLVPQRRYKARCKDSWSWCASLEGNRADQRHN